MHIGIFAGGSVQPGKAVQQALASVSAVIAADSGATTALSYGLIPMLIVGDFDSLVPTDKKRLQELGSKISVVAVEKDETDTELAIQEAVRLGATRITLFGAFGGERFDHMLANVLLLADFSHVPLYLADGNALGWLLRGPGECLVQGAPGDLLSLLPLTADAKGVSSENLHYVLRNETLRFGKPRGISNVLTGAEARVSLAAGLLLIVHIYNTETHDGI